MSRRSRKKNVRVHVVEKSGKRVISLQPTPLASGADGAIHLVDREPEQVAKLYHEPGKDPERLKKLQAMIADPPNLPAILRGGHTYVQIAWPTGWLEDHKGVFRGYAMPKVHLARATSLENFLSRKSRAAFGISDSYLARITAAANLAALVDELHAHGHHIIDLKPMNLNVYTDTFSVAVLDCDGFSIRGPDDERFPAHQYSDGYICPEALRQKLPPQALGEEQDRFALAVIIFRLLNEGLHPYQGVPLREGGVPQTDGERVKRAMYAYGYQGHPDLRPSPWSIHEFLNPETRHLFDRAFTSSDNRPSALEWRRHLLPYIEPDSAGLTVCANDPSHVHFGRDCPWCALELQRHSSRQQPAPRSVPPEKKPSPWLPLVRPALWGIGISLLIGVGVSWLGDSRSIPDEPAIQAAAPVSPERDMSDSKKGPPERITFHLTEKPQTPGMYDNKPVTRDGLSGRARETPRTAIEPAPAPPPSDWEVFISAVKRGDGSKAEEFVSRVDVNRGDEFNQTPLHLAAKGRGSDQDSADIVTLLVAAGADVNAKTTGGRTPLYFAVSKMKLHTAKALLAANADTDIAHRYGWTPLMAAVYEGDERLTEVLLAAGANPNIADENGWTALHFTANSNVPLVSNRDRSDIAKLLIQAGADVTATTRSGYTPLHLAVVNKRPGAFAVMLDNGADPRIFGVREEKLRNAVDSGPAEVYKLLRKAAPK